MVAKRRVPVKARPRPATKAVAPPVVESDIDIEPDDEGVDGIVEAVRAGLDEAEDDGGGDTAHPEPEESEPADDGKIDYEAAREARLAAKRGPVIEEPPSEGPVPFFMKAPADFLSQIQEMNFVSRQGFMFFKELTDEMKLAARQNAVMKTFRVTLVEVTGWEDD